METIDFYLNSVQNGRFIEILEPGFKKKGQKYGYTNL